MARYRLVVDRALRQLKASQSLDAHIRRVYAELKSLGAGYFNMHVPETKQLAHLIHPNEHLRGVVYGRYQRKGGYGPPPNNSMQGRGLLAITENRILFVDKKPMFLWSDEIPLDLVSGVTYSRIAFAGVVTLRTKTCDYTVRTYNDKCAIAFVDAIETSARFMATD